MVVASAVEGDLGEGVPDDGLEEVVVASYSKGAAGVVQNYHQLWLLVVEVEVHLDPLWLLLFPDLAMTMPGDSRVDCG